MLRTKGEAGTGNVVEAVRHARAVQRDIRRVTAMDEDELYVYAKDIRVRVLVYLCFPVDGFLRWTVTDSPTHPSTRLQAPLELVQEVARTGRLPVVNFAAGGVATPADAALMMQVSFCLMKAFGITIRKVPVFSA